MTQAVVFLCFFLSFFFLCSLSSSYSLPPPPPLCIFVFVQLRPLSREILSAISSYFSSTPVRRLEFQSRALIQHCHKELIIPYYSP
ncbi:hypothetical protein M406DRAFT_58784 [Cryphonectria parasitica EP155]|uniref:Secreted protein n=1 Tax=Cryphonectria parasitica (strain ATCC 38755 / EP155) TaxID=660469 RepID=A0A9P5CSB6_CRYP1|nr:uncharacterized protein M406DRAFT_58784 [Cryphonectria parasitica EP155]KAF3769444.1 hypothetical protein M406DRAFT_58784 [Cryphonectria parasitica EP155]